MPKQKQYEDALGSVFDFIFTESKKTPDKRKPVKITGVDGTNEYIEAIGAVLEAPGQFVNKTTINAFNDMVNVDIAAIDLGQDGKEKVKLSLLNIRDVLNNDMKFVDKAFARFEDQRKLGKLAWAGEQLSGIVGATWARKYNLDLDTQQALFNLGDSQALVDKSGGFGEKKLAPKLKTRDYLTKVVKGDFGDYRNVSEDVFKKSFGEERGSEIYKSLQQAFKVYDENIKGNNDEKVIVEQLYKVADSNFQTLYPVFESHNMSMKAAQAKADGNLELAENYKKAQKGVEMFASETIRNRFIEKRKNDLKKYKSEIALLKKSNDPKRDEKLKELKSQINEIDKDMRLFELDKTAKKLGEWEGALSSVQGVWAYTAGGQLLPAIISGDFFDERKNTAFKGILQPTVGKKSRSGIDFKVAKDVVGNKFLSKYNQMMTDAYYMTPGSLVKTLYTGEGFAYRAFKQQNKLEKLMGAEKWKDKVDFSQLFGEKGQEYLDSLTSILDQEKFDTISKFYKSNTKLQKLAFNFGAISRAKKTVTDWFQSKFELPAKAARKFVGNVMIKFLKDGAFKNAVNDWIINGGIKILVESAKVAVKAALSAATGGATALVGWAVDILFVVAQNVAMKVAKPVIKVLFAVVVFGVLGAVAMTILPLSLIFVNAKSQYSHVAPNEIVLGQTDYKVPPSGGPGGGTGTPFDGEPLPDGVSCLLGSSQQYDCTQGAGGSYSHSRLPNAIDIGYIGYFYAPSFCGNGNCQVVENGDYPYCNGYAGGQVVFDAEYGGHTYRFKLVHVEMDPGLSVGDELSAGQVVARIMNHSETGSACSTGTHLHLEMWYDGGMVDPYSILTEGAEDGGFGCSLDPCG